jgi:hypothetical protein
MLGLNGEENNSPPVGNRTPDKKSIDYVLNCTSKMYI